MKKRFLLTLLVIALVLSVAAITVSAAVYRNIKSPRIMYADGGYTAETVTSNGKDFVSAAEVTAVDATSITVSGLTTGTLSYKLKDATTYTNVTLNTNTVVNGEYTITGLTEGATYNLTITNPLYTEGSGSTADRYMFIASDAIEVTTKSMADGGQWPAPVGLSAKEGRLIGTEAGKSYEYAKVTLPAGTVGAYAAYDANNTTLGGGIYAVRIADGNDGTYKYTASEPVSVYVAGANAGTMTHASSTTAAPGTWTVVSPLGNLATGTYSTGSGPYGFAIQVSYAVQEKFIKGAYTYTFTDDEIIPVNDLFGFTFQKNPGTGNHNVKSDNGLVPGLATIYVYGGTEESYSVPFEWKNINGNATTIKLDFTSVYGTNPEGYVYKFEIDLYDETSAKWTEYNVTPKAETELYQHNGTGPWYTYQMEKFTFDANGRIVFDARVAEATPVLAAEGTSTAGVYRITGLDANKNYAISSDNVTFNDVPAKSIYAEVTGEGTYYVYAKGGEKTYDSQVASIKIAGAMPAIPEGTLEYDEEFGIIKGLDILPQGYNTVTYEWCRVSVDGNLAWDQTAVDTDAAVQAGAGYYAFRYAARGNYVAGAPTYIFIYEGGSDKGTISIKAGAAVDKYVPGEWTMFYLPTNNKIPDPYQEGASKRIAAHYNICVEDALDLGYRYQFQDAEIFPISELGTLTFSIGFANGAAYTTSTYPGYVRLYIADGDVTYYDVPFAINEKTISTIDVASLWDDEVEADINFTPKGYVIAMDIRYFREDQVDGLETTRHWVQEYPVLNTNGINVDTLITDGFIGLKETVDISSVSSVPAVGTYGGELVGLNPNATYQFAEYDETNGLGDWITVNEGATTVKGLEKGTYAIRCYAPANDPNFVTTDYVLVDIDELDTQGRETVKMDKMILPEDIDVATAEYVFDIEDSRWINRLALSNIVFDSPNSTIVFEAKNYKFTVAVADIDLTLEAAHYFDMKVTFDGESAYDRMYDKMAAVADEKELVKGIHFESSTPYFFEKATFDVFLGEKYDGYEVELRSFNERVNRLRNEETVTVEGGWASFSVFGGDFLVLSPAYAADAE